MAKVTRIGIIAEDDSDFESATVLIKRVIKKDDIGFKKSIGNGCGKLKRKSHDYAKNLKDRGCNLLILLHDLDRNSLTELRQQLTDSIHPSPIDNHFICIPVEELEAWYLSDPKALKKLFKLKKEPKVKVRPETIKSPKEFLSNLVYLQSEKQRIYLNTKHNVSLAQLISLSELKSKCPSFKSLNDFLVKQKF